MGKEKEKKEKVRGSLSKVLYLFNPTLITVCDAASARKQAPGTRSPQSEYVRLLHNGTCIWWPMFEESVSHCPINVTWFPFDEQRCYLVFESWKYNASQLKVTSAMPDPLRDYHFHHSEQWHLMGKLKPTYTRTV